MDAQTVVALVIVGTAAAFVVRRAWRSVQAARKPTSTCGECGCGKATGVPVDAARRG